MTLISEFLSLTQSHKTDLYDEIYIHLYTMKCLNFIDVGSPTVKRRKKKVYSDL